MVGFTCQNDNITNKYREFYSQEIRDYLIGRLAKKHSVGMVSSTTVLRLPRSPILSWWIFEGKRYLGYEGCLAENFGNLAGHVVSLLKSFNPTWRVLDMPEGRVDWFQTIQRSQAGQTREYFCDVSHVGLSQEEYRVLIGWVEWILAEWNSYKNQVGRPQNTSGENRFLQLSSLTPADQSPIDDMPIRKWTHIAKRSRWPILRSIVAETLRCGWDTQEMDRLPLPESYDKLFEIFCIVQILKHICKSPTRIRWLQGYENDNTIELPHIKCRYQRSFHSTELEPGPLAQAVKLFDVDLHKQADFCIEFDDPKRFGGFNGILVETKSGGCQFKHTLLQLQHYRSSWAKEQENLRILVWGMVENPNKYQVEAISWEQFQNNSLVKESDLWAFTDWKHESLARVLHHSGISIDSTFSK